MKAKGNGKTCMKKRYWTEEGRKWEIIKICQKREGTDYYWGWRKAGRDDSGRSLITVAKSKGKWNGEMGKMEKHNLWESVANTGMEEIRSTGNPGMWEHAKWRPQLKATSPQSRMSRMEWGGEEASIQKGQTARVGVVQGKRTERIKTKELDHPWMKKRALFISTVLLFSAAHFILISYSTTSPL